VRICILLSQSRRTPFRGAEFGGVQERPRTASEAVRLSVCALRQLIDAHDENAFSIQRASRVEREIILRSAFSSVSVARAANERVAI
jgi:hypothetical protein